MTASTSPRRGPPASLFDPAEPETDEDRRHAEWTAPREKKARAKTIADKRFTLALAEVKEMMSTGHWSEAKPLHLVAAYTILHEKVYGVAPSDLTPQIRFFACGLAGSFLKREFEDDFGAAAAFLRWVWIREKAREEYRKANRSGGGRIGWRFQFGPALAVEYRLDLARMGKRA